MLMGRLCCLWVVTCCIFFLRL